MKHTLNEIGEAFCWVMSFLMTFAGFIAWKMNTGQGPVLVLGGTMVFFVLVFNKKKEEVQHAD